MSSRTKQVNFPRLTNNLPEKGTRQSKRGIAATRLQRLQRSYGGRFSRSGISARQPVRESWLLNLLRETFVPRSNLGPMQNDLAAPLGAAKP
jgi:hypothetical protein